MSRLHVLRRWWVLAIVLALAACGGDVPHLPPLGPDAVILAFGDSLTHGNGAAPDESYPAVLARLTGRTVINAGVPGERTPAGAARLPGLLDKYQPGLLILCEGGNDMLRQTRHEQIEANLRRMLEAAKARGVPVVLLGVPEPTLLMRETAPFYAHLAESYGVVYDGKTLTEIEGDDALKHDKIHPNARGYAELAQAVYGLLQARGALPPR